MRQKAIVEAARVTGGLWVAKVRYGLKAVPQYTLPQVSKKEAVRQANLMVNSPSPVPAANRPVATWTGDVKLDRLVR